MLLMTCKEEAKSVDSVTKNSEIPELSDMQTQELYAVTGKVDGDAVTHSVGDQEVVLDIQDKFVVNGEPETLAGATEVLNDGELSVTIMEKVGVNEHPEDDSRVPETGVDGEPPVPSGNKTLNGGELSAPISEKVGLNEHPKDYSRVPETGDDGEPTVVSGNRSAENDVEPQHSGTEQTCSKFEQELYASTGKVDGDAETLSVGDQEVQPSLGVLDVQDKVVVNGEPEALAGATETLNDDELSATMREKVGVKERPKDYSRVSEIGDDGEATVASGSKTAENDIEPQHSGAEQTKVTCSNSNFDQELCASTGKVDGVAVTHSVGDQEVQPSQVVLDIHDKVVVNGESEALTGTAETLTDGELSAITRENVGVNENPKYYSRVPETGGDGEPAVASGNKLAENDVEPQHGGDKQKSVTCSKFEESVKFRLVTPADLSFSEVSTFSCGLETVKMDVEGLLEVKDRVQQSEISQCAKDEKSTDDDMSFCSSEQNNLVDSPVVMTVVDDANRTADEMDDSDEDPVSDSIKQQNSDEKNVRHGSAKPGSFVIDHRVTYQLPPENEGELSVSDLVWGKVKSHPWWPGQIFRPSDSSEKAMKYYRKDCYLVAYFGDRSFAWNDASVLKPFGRHFSQEEKQSNTESFQNAVKCALAEVSRRVELGLACSCISEAAYDKIKYQIVENGGICEGSSKREGVDRFTGPGFFHSAKLTEYVRALAISPGNGVDRLDVTIAKAQLLAFNRLKGCDALAEFQYYDGLMEYVDASLLGGQGVSGGSELGYVAAVGDDKTRLTGPRKRKHNLKDIVYQRRKEKSLTELMGETMYYLDGEFDSHEEDDIMLSSPTSGSKRKASGCRADDFTAHPSTKTISFAKVSHTASSNSQQSFKVGECIRRVANQLTGSSSIIKSVSDGSNSKLTGDDADEVIDAPDDSVTESALIPQKQSSPEEMLSQLQLSARDPMKGYNFLGDIVSFFSEFRNAAVLAQRQQMRKRHGRKRKPAAPAVGLTREAFEFDDRNDSYWTDMVVQNTSEVKPARRGRKRKENRVAAVDSEKPIRSPRRKYSRKQYFHGHDESAADTPPGDEKKLDQLPTELMLNFSDVGSIPSETNLNKMFKRFGPVKECETEVDALGMRAKVVFKKRSDAEVAYSSATMFNIFGSTLVNYQLNYTPVSFGTPPLALIDTVEHAT